MEENKQVIGVDEYEHLKPLIKGNTAKYLKLIRLKAAQDLQSEANNATRRHDDRKAGEFLAKMDGLKLMLKIVKDRVEQYEKERD